MNARSKLKADAFVRRYTNIAYVTDVLMRREMPLLDPLSWDDRNDRHFMNLYQQHAKADKVYAACCTLSNETYHHWRVFGGSPTGAYLEFDLELLEAHLLKLNKEHQLRYGKVEYYTLEKIESRTIKPDDLPFAKRWGFEAEREYRIIANSRNDEQPFYPIPMPLELIGRVVMNPWLPLSVYESVCTSLKNIDGCENLKVSKSQLIDSTRWKVAGTKIVAGEMRKRYAFGKPKKSKTKKR